MPDRTIEIRLVRSVIGEKREARATLRALGLRRVGQHVARSDTPALRGMIARVAHLVRVEDRGAAA
jgi:large subunit ribosomal protein L30